MGTHINEEVCLTGLLFGASPRTDLPRSAYKKVKEATVYGRPMRLWANPAAPQECLPWPSLMAAMLRQRGAASPEMLLGFHVGRAVADGNRAARSASPAFCTRRHFAAEGLGLTDVGPDGPGSAESGGYSGLSWSVSY